MTNDAIPMLTRWGEARPLVRAMLLTSTRAVPNATVDALSDYDVILVVQELAPFVEDRSWLGDFGDVLVVYWDPVHPNPDVGIEQCGNVTQYTNGLKIDFTLWPVALFRQIAAAPTLEAELDAGYRVLLDKDGLTTRLQAPSFTAYVPRPPSPETYLSVINDFRSSAPYVAKCLWRDELLPAKWCLDFDMKHPFLRQMLEWQVETAHGWSVPVGNLGKGLKKRLPPDIWAQLEQTYVGAELADNWDALFATMTLFRLVGRTVGRHLGYQYPEELHEGVESYIRHIQQLERPQA